MGRTLVGATHTVDCQQHGTFWPRNHQRWTDRGSEPRATTTTTATAASAMAKVGLLADPARNSLSSFKDQTGR